MNRKKWLILVLVFVCTLVMVGCNNTTPDITESVSTELHVFNRVSHSDVVGIQLEVARICKYADKTTLVVSWNNTTEHMVTYGKMYWIERLENGEWVDCSLNENVFPAIGYLLNVNTAVQEEYILTNMYDVSIPGTYRFLSSCSVDMGDEKPTECSVWSEFVVE